MKHLSLLFLLSPLSVIAQIPNSNFSDWEIQGDMEIPSGWVFNDDFCCAYIEKVAPSEIGDFALKVYTYYPQLEPFDWAIQTTFAVEEVHPYLFGKYKIDSLVNQGKAIIEVFQLLESTYELIGSIELNDKTSDYEIFNIPLNQSAEADSLRIRITTQFSLLSQMSAGYASITLDTLQFTNVPVSQNDVYIKDLQDFVVFPNPASHSLFVDDVLFENASSIQVYIFDPLGRMIRKQQINATEPSISVASLSNGFYFIKFVSNSNILGEKKIMVVRE